MGENFVLANARSLIYIKKSSGPRIDPCPRTNYKQCYITRTLLASGDIWRIPPHGCTLLSIPHDHGTNTLTNFSIAFMYMPLLVRNCLITDIQFVRGGGGSARLPLDSVYRASPAFLGSRQAMLVLQIIFYFTRSVIRRSTLFERTLS